MDVRESLKWHLNNRNENNLIYIDEDENEGIPPAKKLQKNKNAVLRREQSKKVVNTNNSTQSTTIIDICDEDEFVTATKRKLPEKVVRANAEIKKTKPNIPENPSSQTFFDYSEYQDTAELLEDELLKVCLQKNSEF